ncbi:MAG: HTH-type transcriptional repressor of NAD biosynthesis genes [Polyangiales bacterium]
MSNADVGLVIGKFLPLHQGHAHLLRVAQSLSKRLHIVVCSLADEPIPGALRVRWVEDLFPTAAVHHLDKELPGNPEEHPRFWDLWREALTNILPESAGRVFASEEYGARLADELGAVFHPVDLERAAVAISGTELRARPLHHWKYLPEPVRAHYARRICVFGPESVGKTTLARRLAEHLDTVCVPEYARTYLEQRGGNLRERDLVEIARGQKALEDSLARQANRVLVMDTDTLSTTLWAKKLYGRCDPKIEQLARTRFADLYLLCDVDVPWVKDPVRYLPADRTEFFREFETELKDRELPYVVIRGDWDERWRAAVGAVT